MLLSWVRPFLTFPRKKLYLCLFLLLIRQVVCDSFATPWTCSLSGSSDCDFPGKNTGVGYHFLLQGIFPTQGSNPCLLHGRWILYLWTIWEAPFTFLYPSEQISILPFWVCFESKHIKMHLISGIQHCALTLGNCFPKFVDILLKSIKSVFGEDI